MCECEKTMNCTIQNADWENIFRLISNCFPEQQELVNQKIKEFISENTGRYFSTLAEAIGFWRQYVVERPNPFSS